MNRSISMLIAGLMLSMCFIVNTASSNTIRTTSTEITLYVGGTGPGNYTCIQYAIDNASNGDTVFVYSGTYNESISVNKSIVLQGENNENTLIFAENGEDFAIEILADNVSVLNFKIIGTEDGYTIQIFNNGNSTIKNCIFSEDSMGFILWESCFNQIIENQFNCRIFISDSDNNKLYKNEFTNSVVSIQSSSNNEISYNRIIGSHLGVSTKGECYGNLISYNVIESCYQGIYLGSYGENIISYNDFYQNIWNAFIFNSDCNWYHNYWGRPKVLPKILFGFTIYGFHFDVDWHPALKPNCEE